MLKLDTSYAGPFITPEELNGIVPEVTKASELLEEGKGKGADFIGWRDLPVSYDKVEFNRIKDAARRIRESADVLVVIGIGGSYLGARAVIEFLGGTFFNSENPLQIYFAGNNISGDYLNSILRLCEGKRVCVNVVSKSGTTTEPALAFRVFKRYMEERYGAGEAAKRIFATTDKARGTLKKLCDEQGYECFVIPDDIGGRYSVLTAVGLLPIAAAGYDIDALMEGARAAREAFSSSDMDNDCNRYAAIRNIFYRQGKKVEAFVSYEPRFAMFNEWLKQLFGESEGKERKGIMPSSLIFSTDLHSMGQYVQDGERLLQETVIRFKRCGADFTVEKEAEDFDSLNYLAGKSMSYINGKACEATILAHTKGGVPCTVVELDSADELSAGQLIYFFERACAVSGYMLGVNPFDQPGVEEYKRNMFRLLGKPGYENA